MAGATFNRLKNWTTEILTYADLNAEIDNILNNLTPSGVDDYSTNATQMRLQTSPGSSGSESLATSLAGEIERLRYVIQRLMGTGTTYWYDAPPTTLADIATAISGTGLPTYRIVSGRTTGNSSQLCALIPAGGSSAAVTLSASVTPFIYYIGGTQYSITANVTLSGLSLAPALANCTCTIVAGADNTQWTKFSGQYGTKIFIANAASEITNRVGQLAGFKNGTEFFIANIDSTSALSNAWRGSFFNQSAAAVSASVFTASGTMQLLRLAWIFANTNSSLAITYNNPTVSAAQPTSPSTGDYWFDLSTTAWKTYNSTTWVAANAILIGMTLQDTAGCVAARTFDQYKALSDVNSINLGRNSTSAVQAVGIFSDISVFGNYLRFQDSRPTWDMASHLAAGLSESANTYYYMYLKEDGTPLISDIAPLNRRDLHGLYYPTETWRAVGHIFNDGSSNFATSAFSYFNHVSTPRFMGSKAAYGDTSFGTTNIASLSNFYPDVLHFANLAAVDVTTAAQNTQYQDIATISVPPGSFNISVVARLYNNGATATARYGIMGLGATAGLTFGDIFLSYNAQAMPITTSNQASFNFVMPNVVVNNDKDTSYYLKLNVDTTGAITNLQVIDYSILARRIGSLAGGPA